MATYLTNATALIDNSFQEGITVELSDGVITAVYLQQDEFTAGPNAEVFDCQHCYLVPGFIDTQVNGGGGLLFNDAPTVATIKTIAEAHRKFGSTSILPTLISDDLTVVKTAIEAVGQAIAEKIPGVLGIHIEGPFLNSVKKGIHDDTKFRMLDDEAIDLLSSLKNGITLVTLAPECTTPAMIEKLVKRGVIVSAGHTNGTYTDIQSSLRAGVRGFTHLFNAMSPLESRAPGAVGAALNDKDSYCGIIVDGHHVHPAALRLAEKAKGTDKLMLVTDAMSAVGTDATEFFVQGTKVTVRGGKCIDAHGTLAGSNLNMAAAVENTHEMMKLPLEACLQMASETPANFLGLQNSLGRIAVGYHADLVLLSSGLRTRQTWVNGLAAHK